MGEYSYCCTLEGYNSEDILDLLCDCLEQSFEDQQTRLYLVTAIIKICVQNPNLYEGRIQNLFENFKNSQNEDIQQRVYEFLNLRNSQQVMKQVFPIDASCEDVNVDVNLPFLTSFVESRRLEGQPAYQSVEKRRAAKEAQKKSENAGRESSPAKKPVLNFTAYAKPEPPQQINLAPLTHQSRRRSP